MKKVSDITPTGIRFPPTLKTALKQAAKDEGRSVNNEVLKRMERSLKEDGYLKA